MENDKPKRQTFEIVTDATELSNLAKTKDYPVDIVRDIYIKSDYTLERLAQEYQLPLSQLERIARTGTMNWHVLKQKYEEVRLQTLANKHQDTLIEKQSTLQRMEELNIMRINVRLAEIEAHFKKYGDFFVRTVDEKIMRDGKGQAIELFFPTGQRDLLTLKILADIKEENGARIVSKKAQSKEDKKTIDIDTYGLFLDDKTNK